jgi:hypothetical protein
MDYFHQVWWDLCYLELCQYLLLFGSWHLSQCRSMAILPPSLASTSKRRPLGSIRILRVRDKTDPDNSNLTSIPHVSSTFSSPPPMVSAVCEAVGTWCCPRVLETATIEMIILPRQGSQGSTDAGSSKPGGWSRGKQIGVILGIVAASCIILIIWGALMGRKYWNGYVSTFCGPPKRTTSPQLCHRQATMPCRICCSVR